VRTAGSDALFQPDGARWVPTELARGPWSPDALHGGPVAALVVRAAEHVGDARAPGPLVTTRLSLELLRPVPFEALDVAADVVRPGRRVQTAEVVVTAAGTELARARVTRLRRLPDGQRPPRSPVPQNPGSAGRDAAPPLPDPDAAATGAWLHRGASEPPAFHNGGAVLRFADGHPAELGPATVWVRLAVPVVPGEEPSPAQRAVAAADFGNGISAVVPFDAWRFVNPDLTVVLHRPPRSSWVAVRAETILGEPGIGVASSTLFDEFGPCGSGTQTLVVEPRPAVPT
jgi:hypothetical protein